MQIIVDNWFMIVALVAIVGSIIVAAYKFAKKPSTEQIKSVKEWLLLAVTKAEKKLGSGTGKLKLREVYDAFVAKFPWVAIAVSFSTFSGWVDEALDEMKNMLEQNKDVQLYVSGGESDVEE